jgi:hypothetical protein
MYISPMIEVYDSEPVVVYVGHADSYRMDTVDNGLEEHVSEKDTALLVQ